MEPINCRELLEPLSCRSGKLMVPVTKPLPATLVLSGGAYGTIFATFSCHHRQKCSVSCNSCEKHSSPAVDLTLGSRITIRQNLKYLLFQKLQPPRISAGSVSDTCGRHFGWLISQQVSL